MKKLLDKQKDYDSNVIRTVKVQEFITHIDDKCRAGLESVFLEFKDYPDPIVSTPDMLEFVVHAPSIFGDTWNLLCDLQGMKPNQTSQKQKNVSRIHSVFYEILAMARRENHKLQTIKALGLYPQCRKLCSRCGTNRQLSLCILRPYIVTLNSAPHHGTSNWIRQETRYL